jgi:hypothetical protein
MNGNPADYAVLDPREKAIARLMVGFDAISSRIDGLKTQPNDSYVEFTLAR